MYVGGIIAGGGRVGRGKNKTIIPPKRSTILPVDFLFSKGVSGGGG